MHSKKISVMMQRQKSDVAIVKISQRYKIDEIIAKKLAQLCD